MLRTAVGCKERDADMPEGECALRNALDLINPPFMIVAKTVLGQHYGLHIKKRLRGGWNLFMQSADERFGHNVTFPMQIGGPFDREEAEDMARDLQARLARSPLFSLSHQPPGISIPFSKELITLREVSPITHPIQLDYRLKPGDEVYTECRLGRLIFYHSGIYAGNGLVYHFMNEADTSFRSVLRSFAPVKGCVVLEPWEDYVHAIYKPEDGTMPRVYRAAYKLRVRSGPAIVEWAEIIKNSKAFTHYDIRKRNCQHFTSLCSTGASFSYDMSSMTKSLGSLLLKPASTMMGGGRISPRRSLSDFQTIEPKEYLKPTNAPVK